MAEERKELDWDLNVSVPERGVHRKIRVTSNESVAVVMMKVASKLGDGDWTDFALWWPDKQIWLNKPRQSLYAYGIMSDAKLEFTSVRRTIIIELPDKSRYSVRVNLSVMTFFVVAELCQELGIRHHEELSLLRSPFDREGFVKLTGYHKAKVKKPDPGSREGTPGRDLTDHGAAAPGSPSMNRKPRLPQLALSPDQRMSLGGPTSGIQATKLPDAPEMSFFSEKLQRTIQEKSFINGLWLDSSKTLYEQEVSEGALLYLRFKYHCFKDIDPKLDEMRIIQMYHQAKWSILTEEVDCTEEEAYTFAALQFQVKLAQSTPAYHQGPVAETTDQPISDINAAIDQLQVELGQKKDPTATESRALQLTGYCKFTKPTRLTFKGSKRFFFLLKNTTLSYYRHEDSYTSGEDAIQRFNLTGAEAIPDLEVAKRKFAFNIVLPSSDETGEIRLTLDTSDEYCSWMAGCKMAMKGRPLAKQGYEQELKSIKGFVAMQNKADPHPAASDTDELRPEDLVSTRIMKKSKAKVIARQILEAHSSMLNMSLMDARMQYIRSWQALVDFGITYFIVRLAKMRKDEVLGIAYNRLVLFEMGSMEQKKVWRYSAMKSWNVNWESKQMRVDHEQDSRIAFQCLSADLKVVHEFIGANIWLSLRKEDEPLDVSMFVKLTGGVTSNLEGWGAETMAKFIS